jgi:hypothetical protein
MYLLTSLLWLFSSVLWLFEFIQEGSILVFLIISSENHWFQFFGEKKNHNPRIASPNYFKNLNASVVLMKEQMKINKTKQHHVLCMFIDISHMGFFLVGLDTFCTIYLQGFSWPDLPKKATHLGRYTYCPYSGFFLLFAHFLHNFSFRICPVMTQFWMNPN